VKLKISYTAGGKYDCPVSVQFVTELSSYCVVYEANLFGKKTKIVRNNIPVENILIPP
jgi:hypothetical protein